MISNVNVYGLEESIRASKYPMSADVNSLNSNVTKTVVNLGNAKMGSGHDNFLNGIVAQFDLTFTVKAWTEAERYHFLDFVSSQSTMHCITKIITAGNPYNQYVDNRIVEIMREKVKIYNDLCSITADKFATMFPEMTMSMEEYKKKLYLEILYSNPCGMKLTARMTTNYRQLKTIYNQRKDHRLPEWREFCKQLEELPMFKELCLSGL